MANLSNAFNKAGNFALKSGYNTSGEIQPEIFIGNIIQTILQFIGVLFLCFVIYGGFIWMTATDEAEKVKRAKKIIKNSVIGLVIVVLAYAISAFVVQSVLQDKLRNI